MVIQETRLGYGVTGRPETPGNANAQIRRRSKVGSDRAQLDFWVIFYKCKDNNGNGWISLLPLNLTYPRCIDSAASHLEGMGLEGVDIQVLVGDVTHWWMLSDNSSKLTYFSLSQFQQVALQVDDVLMRFYDYCAKWANNFFSLKSSSILSCPGTSRKCWRGTRPLLRLSSLCKVKFGRIC